MVSTSPPISLGDVKEKVKWSCLTRGAYRMGLEGQLEVCQIGKRRTKAIVQRCPYFSALPCAITEAPPELHGTHNSPKAPTSSSKSQCPHPGMYPDWVK